MSSKQLQYPFDPSGDLQANKVEDFQSLNLPGDADFHIMIPRVGPYHGRTMRVTHVASGKELKDGVDFVKTHMFWAATKSIGTGIYGSVSIIDRTLAGQFRLEYQTLGGDWVVNDSEIVEILANLVLNPRTTYWEQIVDVPCQFPVVNHTFDIEDFTGAKDIVDVLKTINESLLLSNRGKQLKGRSELPPIRAVTGPTGALVTLGESFTKFANIELDVTDNKWVDEICFEVIGGRASGLGDVTPHSICYILFSPVPVDGKKVPKYLHVYPGRPGAPTHDILGELEALEISENNFRNVLTLWLKDTRLRSAVNIIDHTESSVRLLPVGYHSQLDAMTTYLPVDVIKFEKRS